MNSLKIRFVFILTFTSFALFIFLWNDSRMLANISQFRTDIVQIKQTHIQLLEMRRAEKDFFVRKELRYYDKLLEIAENSKKDFIKLGFEEDFNNYIENFKNITHHMKLLGLNNESGLTEEFLLHAYLLENELEEEKETEKLIQFLTMRKYEKDFFLHKDVTYLQLHEEILEKIKKDIILECNIATFLENYSIAFINLKLEMMHIGLNENEGLHAQMRDAAHKIEEKLNLHIQTYLPRLEKNLEQLEYIRSIVLFAFFSSLILFFFFILKPMYHAFLSFKSFFTDFKDSDERMNLEKIKFTEIQEIATTINKMLDTRKLFEEDLIAKKDEAIRLQKVKEQFLTNMSHELRTPLNAIIGFSSILNKKYPNEHNLIQPISQNSNHLLEILNDILDVSKIQSSNFHLKNEIYHLEENLLSFVQNFNYVITQKHIHFITNFSIDKNLSINGDWMRLSQVIGNLLSNALKFTPEFGEVKLSVSCAENILSISVQDNGIGISKEVQSRIFKSFEQADSSSTKNYEGAGLGLSISKSIITMMDGEIILESGIGVGTTFSVRIPVEIVKQTITPLDETPQEEYQFDAHVLIVEDNKTNQLLLSMLLEDVGITYDIANDGLEAVEMYEDGKYDLVLMDENMPNMNGVDAMQKIKQEHSNPSPIIAVTANVMKGDEARLLEAGMDGFVPKPIDDEELYQTIKKFLNAH